MIARVPKWVCDVWRGPKGVLTNINYRNRPMWYYIGTDLDELRDYLDSMLHHGRWSVDSFGDGIEPLGEWLP